MILRNLKASLILFRECVYYFFDLNRYNASIGTDMDISKMEYTLLRENHVIEKGMSMRQPRLGFGQTKVLNLLERLDKYYELYGDERVYFITYPLSTINMYIHYTNNTGVEIKTIKSRFEELLSKCNISLDSLNTQCAGIKNVYRDTINEVCSRDFTSLLFNRHSIRYFSDELPSKELIDRALEIAQRTPSACNRQAWHTHIYMGECSHNLLKKQSGCNGFEKDIHCSIVVTANMKAFLHYEPFQQYVDGGLYAMNLINALQSVGIGSIPLSCGFYSDHLKQIKDEFEIPSNETMIVIIGCGLMQENFNVAMSSRKTIQQTNTYHNEDK